jgi:hypothetical protein
LTFGDSAHLPLKALIFLLAIYGALSAFAIDKPVFGTREDIVAALGDISEPIEKAKATLPDMEVRRFKKDGWIIFVYFNFLHFFFCSNNFNFFQWNGIRNYSVQRIMNLGIRKSSFEFFIKISFYEVNDGRIIQVAGDTFWIQCHRFVPQQIQSLIQY